MYGKGTARFNQYCIDNPVCCPYITDMKTQKKVARIEFRSTPEQLSEFSEACKKVEVSASTIIRDLCKAAIPYMATQCKDGQWRPPVLADREAHTWGLPELQIVLDHAKTVDEVKDLIDTVLQRNLISWDTPIPTDREGYLKMIKDAVKARLKELREVSK